MKTKVKKPVDHSLFTNGHASSVIDWFEDREAVRRFKSLQMEYEVCEIPWGAIDRDKSLKNQSRLGEPLIEDGVAAIAIAALKEDACFPMMVVWEESDGVFVLAGGNHRYNGISAAKVIKRSDRVPVYKLLTKDRMLLDIIIRALNCSNGNGVSRSDSIQQALLVVRKYPHLSQREIAKQFNLDESSVSRAKRAEDAAELLSRNGVNASKLTITGLLEILKAGSEPAIVEAGRAAVRHGFNTDDIRTIVGAAKSQRSDSTKVAAIQEAVKSAARFMPNPVERKSSIKSQFFACLGTLYGIVAKNPSLAHLHCTNKEDADEALDRWLKISESMEKIFE